MSDFDAQAERFAEQIEEELENGHLNFPTALDVSMRIRRLADNPDSSLDEIATAVKAEPVLSAKAVRMANAIALNPYGAPVTSVNNAVQRIGLSAVRCLAFAVSAEQLAQDHRSKNMRELASAMWRHSIDVAAWAYAMSRKLRVGSPDTAMFAGMMLDIGYFFLLARVSDYPAMEEDPKRLAEFLLKWSQPVGRTIFEIFELPEPILDILEAERPYEGNWPPSDLREIVHIATVAAESHNPFRAMLKDSPPLTPEEHRAQVEGLAELLESATAEREGILAAVCG